MSGICQVSKTKMIERQTMTVLQNILYPTEEICTCTDLYWHDTDAGRVYDGYFNLFSSGKWATYTELNSVALQLEVREACEISVWSENGLVSEEKTMGTEQVTLELPPPSQQQFLWFSVKRPASDKRIPENQSAEEPCLGNNPSMDPLIRAAFVTDQETLRAIHSAITICTYRREEYVKRNLRSLCEAILQNPDSPLYGMIDVLLVDNGQTLTAEEISAVTGGSSRIHLIPNRNAGGSGGFTRGMLEALNRQREEGFTHIILTDDDAVLEPDAFLRCHALLAYLKPAYRQHCVAGIMLDLEKPYQMVEAGALYQDGRPQPVGKGADLRDLHTVWKYEEPLHVDYAGWWWACFPLDAAQEEIRQAEAGQDGIVRENNLPMPYFIHFDDMEYGLRNGGKTLYLNGICVWHESFDRRLPQTDLYYGTRNRMITNAIHSDTITLRQELMRCLGDMGYNLLRYQYTTSDLVLQAVKDFTCGPKAFSRIDPEERNSQIRAMADPFLPLDKLGADEKETIYLKNYARDRREHVPQKKSVSRGLYILSLNGWLLPARRGRRKHPVCCSLFSPDMRELYRAKQALLIDIYVDKGARIEKDYRKALHSLGCMAEVTMLLLTRYRVCARAYRKHAGRLTSREFWERYLGKGGEQGQG